jgi:hypothetical protein
MAFSRVSVAVAVVVAAVLAAPALAQIECPPAGFNSKQDFNLTKYARFPCARVHRKGYTERHTHICACTCARTLAYRRAWA